MPRATPPLIFSTFHLVINTPSTVLHVVATACVRPLPSISHHSTTRALRSPMTGDRTKSTSESVSRRRPNFSTRTAEEDAARLAPSDSAHASPEESSKFLNQSPAHPYEPIHSSSRPPHRQRHSLPSNFFGNLARWRERDGHHDGGPDTGDHGGISEITLSAGPLRESSSMDQKVRDGHKGRLSDISEKLGTFSGVFVPTTLNVLSILMFLRFGFILGQAGLLGMLGTSKAEELAFSRSGLVS